MVVWSCAPTKRPAEKQGVCLRCGEKLAGLRPFLVWYLSRGEKKTSADGAFVHQRGLEIGRAGPRCL